MSLLNGLTPVGNEFVEYRGQLFAHCFQSSGHVNIVKIAEGSCTGKRLCTLAFGEGRDDVNAINSRSGFPCFFSTLVILLTPIVGFGEVVLTQDNVETVG